MALVRYNQRHIYSELIAIERHLGEHPSENAAVPSHCVRKHSLQLLDHDAAELINHSSRIDPALADDAREFRQKAERVLKASNDLSDPSAFKPDLAEVAALRNEFRQMVGDPTVVVPCGVCDQDGGPAAQKAKILAEIQREQPPESMISAPEPPKKKPAARKTSALSRQRIYFLDLLRR